MAETQVLYDASGREVQVDLGPGGGLLYPGGPTDVGQAQPTARPAAAPITSYQDPQTPAATTQTVQGTAEYAGGDLGVVVEGGDTYIPFGPEIAIEQDDSGADIDPGYPYAWTDGGARRTFRIAPSIGLMPLLRFAHAAKAGLDTDDLEGMAALYDMISDCVHPDDWPAFMSYATVAKSEDEELMEFVSAAMEVITARPRKPRGSSSATSRRTSLRSKGSSSKQATVIPPGTIVPPEADGLMGVGELVS